MMYVLYNKDYIYRLLNEFKTWIFAYICDWMEGVYWKSGIITRAHSNLGLRLSAQLPYDE